MTYNGSVPGPLLEGHVGDRVIVHFTNHLSEPTSVHWHGVRVPADMDGSPMAQDPVPPGGSFDYQFELLDAGTFWYHTHYDEPVQMEHGLYGPIIVHGDNEPTVDAAGVIMLDDLLLGTDGQIAPEGDLLEQHSGREGNILLVNGRAGVTLPMRAGETQRWRIINAGSARFYRLGLAGHRFTVLGTDGGLLPKPYEADDVLIVPGQRLDVLVQGTGAPGSRTMLQNLPYDRGHGAGVVVAEDVMTVQYVPDRAATPLALPTSGPSITPLRADGITPKSLSFDEVLDESTQTIRFLINGQSYPNVPVIEAKVGTTEIWDLENLSEMDHPFHLHGFFFQILSQNGVAESTPAWHDTVDLKGNETMRIAFQPEGRPGMWMYHCHILEHAANGMMAGFQVNP
jgi:FtsP/CotA-like multicopper oxidase with cupredoxin domain